MAEKIKMSASSISEYKRCPTAFMAKYLEKIRRIDQTEAQRRGTNWHELQEVIHLQPESVCRACANQMKPDSECPVCQGTGYLVGDSVDATIRVLDVAYAGGIPADSTAEEIQTERAKLLYSLSGYKWYWGIGENEPEYEVVATEVPFELTVVNPKTGNPCRDAVLVGKIDKIVRMKDGTIAQVEHKSTSKPIDSGSVFWNHLQMDTQTTLYPYAMLRMQKEGRLEHLGIMPDDPIATTVYYDVWHTPGIKMKKLSQGDTRKFVETGEYYGGSFEVENVVLEKEGRKTVMRYLDSGTVVTADGHEVEIIEGKGGDAFKETESMYGQRILKDITDCPDKFFARREIQRSLDEMTHFEGQIYSTYQCILMMRRTGHWIQCERECDSKFRCNYTSYCYHQESINANNILEGFEKR